MAPPTVTELRAASALAEGPQAAADAVARASSGIGQEPTVTVLFSSGIPGTDVAEAVGGVKGTGPVVGMTGNGVIGGARALDHGASALALAGGRTGIGVRRDASGRVGAAAKEATAEAIARSGGDPGLVILLLDSRSGDQADAVAGAYEAAGPGVPLVGGAGGGAEPAQFVGGECIEDAVVAVALATGDIGIGHAHGCRVTGDPAIATRSDGRTLQELDGRPAAEVYLENLGMGGTQLSDQEFEQLAVTHPLAQPELRGDARLRHILERGPDGSLICATHIPPNAAIEFTHQTPADIVEACDRAVSMSLAEAGGQLPAAALVFDCAGRKRAVAGSLAAEVERISGAFGPHTPPLAGVFSHGEVSRIRGAKGDRNHAVVVASLF